MERAASCKVRGCSVPASSCCGLSRSSSVGNVMKRGTFSLFIAVAHTKASYDHIWKLQSGMGLVGLFGSGLVSLTGNGELGCWKFFTRPLAQPKLGQNACCVASCWAEAGLAA